MKIVKPKFLLAYFFIYFFAVGCGEEEYLPKPKSYFRLDFPKKEYQTYQSNCPYSFEYPTYSAISQYTREVRPCWFNLDFPQQKARIHFSYHKINGDLHKQIEDSRMLVYKHTVKATNIEERIFKNDEKNVFSVLYSIEGNAASALQFFITDSSSHFLRGALYFSSFPNADSLSPSIDFIEKDINHFLKTFSWKENVATL